MDPRFWKSNECSVLMEINQKNKFFCNFRSSPRLHLIPNTLRYSHELYNETDNTECTAWYTMALFSQLEDLDYADDIELLSTTENHPQKKAQLLTENARKTGLQINQIKTKVICINLKERQEIKIGQEELGMVIDFTYLGSKIIVENSVQKDISTRINKPRHTYCSLRNMWKSTVYSRMTKVQLFNSNVISVLLYGCQNWRFIKNDMHKLDVFQTYGGYTIYSGQIRCPMKICTEGQILYQ